MSSAVYRYLVVDDEPIAHRIIDDYCQALPHLSLAHHAYDAMQAMAYLAEHSVELIFLDLNMPKLKGFDLLRSMPIRAKVIVTSAHQEFALDGYDLDIADYLLKPFSFERFVKAVNRALGSAAAPQPAPDRSSAPPPLQRIFVKGDRQHHQVALHDIRYVEGCGNYCVLRTIDANIITHRRLSDFEQELPAAEFLRVHKSYLVALDKISSIGSQSLQIGDAEIPIGQTYKQRVMALLQG
ncbi:LytR/AlgR family response regulator transcription factor [Pseudomarimonas arenosa]|uniref:Response regulator transcription factor n=1 Tax=Pseudomarimonas arenosa TaxID=2774145 RepID=A0AAW3ZNX9_9GAMM|nr:LytTR family DNA-binding domain-containing protein [Pseudomarimonas arenosa]MBD8526884.1 response regulator transcription factor [Pseudomarimonas arenosa]